MQAEKNPQRKLQFPYHSRFFFFVSFSDFFGGGFRYSLPHWNITAPITFEIRLVKKDVKEFRDYRPA